MGRTVTVYLRLSIWSGAKISIILWLVGSCLDAMLIYAMFVKRFCNYLVFFRQMFTYASWSMD